MPNCIQTISIDRFRGIRSLKLSGLGRVNLITGKNDAGKSTVIEAVQATLNPEEAPRVLAGQQQVRDENFEVEDFEGGWKPLFFNGKAEDGLSLVAEFADGGTRAFQARKGKPAITTTRDLTPGGALANASWSLDCVSYRNGIPNPFELTGGPAGVRFQDIAFASLAIFIRGRPGITNLDIQNFSRIKQDLRDAEVANLMKMADPDIQTVELLAPSGHAAKVFVRVKDRNILAISMMGEGIQRIFEFAVSMLAEDTPCVTIDEFENGLHHSTLESIWSWIARWSASRSIQVFATTHSLECVHAAGRAFGGLKDDGLRVIRLDRRELEVTAAVYDSSLIPEAIKNEIELRG